MKALIEHKAMKTWVDEKLAMLKIALNEQGNVSKSNFCCYNNIIL